MGFMDGLMGGGMPGMGGGGGNEVQATTTTVRRAPWFEEAGQDALRRATELSDRPYEAYDGTRVAGLSTNEQSAYNRAGTLGNQTSPYMKRLNSGFSSDTLGTYMNPYVDSVLAARQRNIGNEYGRQSSALSRDQAATDAFRSGRSDLARSRLNMGRMRALDDAENETRAAAFESAKDSYFKQGAQDLGAVGAIQQTHQQDMGDLTMSGMNDRSIRQAESDFRYGEFLERRDWDVNNLNNLLSAIQAVEPTAGTRRDTGPAEEEDSGEWGAILGVVGTAIGAYYGNPQMGGAIGSGVGGMIDSDQNSKSKKRRKKKDTGGW